MSRVDDISVLLRRLKAYKTALGGSALEVSTNPTWKDYQSDDFAAVVEKTRGVLVGFLQFAGEPDEPDEEGQGQDKNVYARANDQSNWSHVAKLAAEGLKVIRSLAKVLNTILQYQQQKEQVLHEERSRDQWEKQREMRRSKSNKAPQEDISTDEEDLKQVEEEALEEERQRQRDQYFTLATSAAATIAGTFAVYQMTESHSRANDASDLAIDAGNVAVGGDAAGLGLNGDLTRVNAITTGQLISADASAAVEGLALEGISLGTSLRESPAQVWALANDMDSSLERVRLAYLGLAASEREATLVSFSAVLSSAAVLAQIWRQKSVRAPVGVGAALTTALWLLKPQRDRDRTARVKSARRAAIQVLGLVQAYRTNLPAVKADLTLAVRQYREKQKRQLNLSSVRSPLTSDNSAQARQGYQELNLENKKISV